MFGVFKNCTIYRLPEQYLDDGDDDVSEMYYDALDENADVDIQPGELQRPTWTSPYMEEDGDLTLTVPGTNAFVICMRTQKRLIPAAVLNQRVLAEVKKRVKATDFPVPKTEKEDIRQAILGEMLQVAFIQSSWTMALVDPDTHLLLIDSCTTAVLDDFTTLLRASLSSQAMDAQITVPVVMPEYSVSKVFAGWITNSDTCPPGVFLSDKCVLEGDGKARVSAANTDLESVMSAHVEDDAMVAQSIRIVYQNKIECTITNDLYIKSIALSDIALEELTDLGADSQGCMPDDLTTSQTNPLLIKAALIELVQKLLTWFAQK